jgi:hypothetical protein
MKRILSFFLTLVLTAALLCPAALAVNETAAKDRDWVYITLDPGHGGDGAGGNDSGAVNEKYGYQEADLVLKIGLYLKEELETYRNVHVDMTRSDSYGTRYTPLREVKQRVDFAAEKCSDLLVSLHLNSAGSNQSVHGGLILASNGNYDPDCAKVIDAVGTNILAQLSRLGIDTSRGLIKEGSHDGTTYPNGKLADYYGIVRYGQLRHIPAMIAFVIYLIAGNAEVNRGPFDLPEAESELTAGYHTEYSGMHFGLFYVAEFVNLFVVSGVAATIFLGGWMPLHIPGWEGFNAAMDYIPGFVWFFGKAFFVVWLLMWIKWTFPRLRIDQILTLEWKYLVPIGLANLLLMVIVVVFKLHF